MIYTLTAAALFPVLLVVLGLRPVTDRELALFTARYYLPAGMTSPTLPLAVARSRGFRLIGAALGFSLPVMVRAFTHDSVDVGSALFWGLGGYLGGALAAALMPTTPSDCQVRVATLVPRRASDYLPRRTLVAPAVTVGLSVTAALVYVWTPRRAHSTVTGSVVGAVVLSVVAGLVAVVGTRLVVRRRQAAPDQEVLTIDDALRSHGLHLVVGTGITVGALAAAGPALQVAFGSSIPVLQWLFRCLALAEFLFAGFAWGRLRKAQWRVRAKVPS